MKFRRLGDLANRPSITTLLWQDEMWVDRLGTEMTLEQMTPDHRRNLLNLLEKNAENLHFRVGLRLSSYSPQGEMASDDVDRMIDQHMDTDPVVALSQYPLIQRLRTMVSQDIHDAFMQSVREKGLAYPPVKSGRPLRLRKAN